MSYNRVGTPKFYMDAVLLARQWGMIETESSDGKFYLNPSKVTSLNYDSDGIDYITMEFKQRYWINSLDHVFILGHNFMSTGVEMKYTVRTDTAGTGLVYPCGDGIFLNDTNGWHYLPHLSDVGVTDDGYKHLYFKFYNSQSAVNLSENANNARLGDLSVGWSWEAPHSPDLELTLNYSNESISTQTTKGGHTLTNAGYSHKAGWIKPAWARGDSDEVWFENAGNKVYPSGRRQWSLKFSYVNDTDLFSSSSHDSYGIFANISGDTADINDSLFSIKEDFASKVMYGTNNFQIPFIFQPNKDVEEFAICRINNDTASFNQVANNVYDISLDIVEVW